MEDKFQVLGENNEQTSLSIKDLFYKYLRFSPLFIISIALSLFVAYIYLRYSTPIYSASGALIITLLTISFQAIKAAIANPVKSLRTE